MSRIPLGAICAMLILASCTEGNLGDDVALSSATFVRLDLRTLAVTAVAAPQEVETSAGSILLRRIGDEGAFIALTEMTRGQWRTLTGEGSDVWRDELASLPSSLLDSLDGDGMPMTGLPAVHIVRRLSGLSAGQFRLALPESSGWRTACLAGATTRFSWGEGDADEIARAWAVTETVNNSLPLAVGSRQANAWGFYDMHGNAWEMMAPIGEQVEIRGGASDQPVAQCHADLAGSMPASDGHPLVGFRLALVR